VNILNKISMIYRSYSETQRFEIKGSILVLILLLLMILGIKYPMILICMIVISCVIAIGLLLMFVFYPLWRFIKDIYNG
jgi:hypothetical protein